MHTPLSIPPADSDSEPRIREPRPSAPTSSEPKTHLGRWIAIAVLLVGVAFVVGLLPRLRQYRAVVATTHELAVTTVTVVSPRPGKTGAPLSLPAEIRPYIEAPIYARAITVGQNAEVTLNGSSGRKSLARIVRTAGALDATSRTLLTELELPNADNAILPGGYVQVRFIDANLEVPLTIPANTLLMRPEGPSVGVVKPDGEVEVRVVELGRDFGGAVELLKGVSPEDRLILNPSDLLATGLRVRVAAASPPAGRP